MAARKQQSQLQLNPYIKKWIVFCNQKQIDPYVTMIDYGLEFLTTVYNTGVSHSCVATARNALSSFVKILNFQGTFGEHYLTKKFMAGVQTLRPSVPRYSGIWDIKVVFNWLRTLGENYSLSTKNITYKVILLLALLTGQRGQSLHMLDIHPDYCTIGENQIVFIQKGPIKQSRPGYRVPDIVIQSFNQEPVLCPVRAVKAYLVKTLQYRQSTSLLLSLVHPFAPISRDTLSRWTKDALKTAGVNVEIYKPHSTRAASASAAAAADVPVAHIMACVGWSSERVFATYYKKPIHTVQNMGTMLLQANQQNL